VRRVRALLAVALLCALGGCRGGEHGCGAYNLTARDEVPPKAVECLRAALRDHRTTTLRLGYPLLEDSRVIATFTTRPDGTVRRRTDVPGLGTPALVEVCRPPVDDDLQFESCVSDPAEK
jgi:hypothetical protein